VIILAILLLSTEACHLCELAQSVLQQVFGQPDMIALSQQANFQIYLQDIIDQPLWLDQYAEKIPVLLDESSNLTLEWPFDASQATQWLEKVAENTGSLSS
jgi:hypothetical protein